MVEGVLTRAIFLAVWIIMVVIMPILIPVEPMVMAALVEMAARSINATKYAILEGKITVKYIIDTTGPKAFAKVTLPDPNIHILKSR